MDGNRFDSLARLVGARASRRSALALLAALGAAARPAAEAEAGRQACRPRCTACQTCARGACRPDRAKDGRACAGGTGVCARGACKPCGAPGQPCCAGKAPCADFGCCDPETGRCVAGGGVWGVDFEPECAGENMVCDCRPELTYYDPDLPLDSRVSTPPWFTCTQPGVCRANSAPVAVELSLRNPWRSPCTPITLVAIDAERDHAAFFRIKSLPQNGFLTVFIDSGGGGGEPSADYPLYGQILGGGPGPDEWAAPGPPPPLDGVRRDCYPNCLYDGVWCGDMDLCPGYSVHDRENYAGGWVQMAALCYVPFESTRTGFDSFTYAAFDQYGAEGPPAAVDIEIFET